MPLTVLTRVLYIVLIYNYSTRLNAWSHPLVCVCISYYCVLQYLRETLTGFILQLLETEDDCEVDPSRLAPTASLYTNQQVLTRLIKRVWLDILASWTKFPRYITHCMVVIATVWLS